MTDLAKHARIYDPAPEDDTISKRSAAIDKVVAQLKKTTSSDELIGLASAVSEAFSSEAGGGALREMVLSEIQKTASAFIELDNELELSVITIMSVIAFLEGADTATSGERKDLVSAALWSVLGFQGVVSEPKMEALRQELLSHARDRCLNRADEVRQRKHVAKNLQALPDGADETQLKSAFASLLKGIEALRDNAALDQEELDMAWWSMGGRSPLLEVPYEDLDAKVRGIVRGVELGKLMRQIPSRAHRNLALTHVPTVDAFGPAALSSAFSEHRDTLAAHLPSMPIITNFPTVFPLLTCIISADAVDGPDLTGDDWSARALLETTIASLCASDTARY